MLRRSVPVLLACLLVAAACAKSGEGEGSTSLRAYLGQLPAPREGDGTILVNYADLARASEIGGLERPDDPGDDDARACAHEPLGHRSADPPRPAGDDRDPSREIEQL